MLIGTRPERNGAAESMGNASFGAGVWTALKVMMGLALRFMGLSLVIFASWPICLYLADPTTIYDGYVVPVCALAVGLGVVTAFIGRRILRKSRERRFHGFGV